MRIAKIVRGRGKYPEFEVHAEQNREYENRPSFEELGPGLHREITVGTYAEAVNYCRNRGYSFFAGIVNG